MEKQTAVDWFVDKVFGKNGLIIYDELIQQAKAIEKEQIINAFVSGSWLPACRTINSEQYYNETYNK
jgi:hypothetical protein